MDVVVVISEHALATSLALQHRGLHAREAVPKDHDTPHDHGAAERNQDERKQHPRSSLGPHRASSAFRPISRMISTISVCASANMSTNGTSPVTASVIPSPIRFCTRCINGAQVHSRFCPSAMGTMTSSL